MEFGTDGELTAWQDKRTRHLNLLFDEGFLLDDLAAEFEGQHIQNVDRSVVAAGKQKMQ